VRLIALVSYNYDPIFYDRSEKHGSRMHVVSIFIEIQIMTNHVSLHCMRVNFGLYFLSSARAQKIG
jgi:hypothetical protein